MQSNIISLRLFYNYGRLPFNHVVPVIGGRLIWHHLDHDKAWVKDRDGNYYCKFCGKKLENKRLRKFCPTTNCEREYDRLFVQYDCWSWFRDKVLVRDNGHCVKCNKELAVKEGQYWNIHTTFVCDHIIPLFKGGRDWWQDPDMSNFQTLCEECNKVKTAADLFVPKSIKDKRKIVNIGWIFDTPSNHSLEKWL